MGTSKQSIVEVNGKRYDARTGHLIERQPQATPKKARLVNDFGRNSAASATVHKNQQRSQTLMRTGVKRPTPLPKADVKAAKPRTVSDFKPALPLAKRTLLPSRNENERQVRAFSAVSLDPPLVLVCVGYNSRSYHGLVAARRYAIHILREDQVGIARAFARPGMARGDVVPWSLNARGLPVLDDYLTLLECRLAEEHRGGDHAILVGEVESISAPDEDARPLLYYRGRLQEAGR